MENKKTGYIRNFFFGVEDSLVSTVGFVSGIAAAGVRTSTLVLTGIVLIFVEAFSMAVGSFLSDTSAREFASRHEVSEIPSIRGGLIMFFSYFGSGIVVLAPYLWMGNGNAFIWSVVLSLGALFLLGLLGGGMCGLPPFRRGIRMVVTGGGAIVIGVLVGKFVLAKLGGNVL